VRVRRGSRDEGTGCVIVGGEDDVMISRSDCVLETSRVSFKLVGCRVQRALPREEESEALQASKKGKGRERSSDALARSLRRDAG
jgi:hypothetical protein